MLQFIWFYVWHITLVPLGILLIKPFHYRGWHQHVNYMLTDLWHVNHRLTEDEPLITRGYVMANHRSWLDFFLDPYFAKSCVMGRRMAFIAGLFFSIVANCDGLVISFVRGKETRVELFKRVKKHICQHDTLKRVVFWPEGTRHKYTHLDSSEEVKTYLKYGMLKSIYEDNDLPVQIQISSNKEYVFDEKKMHIKYYVDVHTHRSKSIYPKDFATEQAFYDEIARVWYDCWVIAHRDKDVITTNK